MNFNMHSKQSINPNITVLLIYTIVYLHLIVNIKLFWPNDKLYIKLYTYRYNREVNKNKQWIQVRTRSKYEM